MATGPAQSQFRRYLSLVVLALTLSAALLGVPPPVLAQEPARGAPFFLLSDASYGSNEEAKVRFEATNMGAVAEYGGADVYIYRIPRPLDFLQRQKNLHRVQVDGNLAGTGLANALRYSWDRWYVRSRQAWRGLFSGAARGAAVKQAPELAIKPGFDTPTRFRQDPQYKPIKGLDLQDSFRYPIAAARPIEPPQGVQLDGSSSEFIAPGNGNVMIPLGRRQPGLYLVEAVVGQHRATTLLFVADTVAITKISAGQLLTWAAGRRNGEPVAGTRVLWTDGSGVLKSGVTDTDGLAIFERSAPEQTYVMGEDKAGGVFISENYYYDSEIYNAKLYAVTDRPLYRPGDQVFIKVIGRDFVSARESRPVASGELLVQVFDPNGLPVTRQKITLASDSGADTSFRLPDNSPAGGYEIRFDYRGDRYGAAFRVAEYQKPHFEIAVLPDKPDFRTGEAVTGRLQLAYPDGKPVRNANVELSVRAQQMTMVDGDLGYGGQFPVKLAAASFKTDDKGVATFALPPATDPSRYVLTVFATDGAAYRVKTTRELLVESGGHAWTLKADRQFSAAGERVEFAVTAAGEAGSPPVRWEWVRLENRAREEGRIERPGRVSVVFPGAGSYTLTLRDANNNVVAAASHFVSGAGAKAPAGSIAIVFDRRQYRPGDTAEALITFPDEVAHALLTLERDKVEKTSMLAGTDWVKLERLTPTQWRARLPVAEHYGPNITLSVAYAKDGDYVFQNQGLKVDQPRIDLEFKLAKATYAPGEKVDIDILAHRQGKPVAASVAVGVVDEMIYVLQPEIAPDIFDFFYHPRRNNVRTAASLGFIGYDLASPRTGKGPSRRQVHERAVKVLERPRREEVDTAFWHPRLKTDADGRARFSFTMPDSLTRWRITGRAIDDTGTVGQKTAWLRSEKTVYLKWTSPDWLRDKDAPMASVALFNQSQEVQKVEFSAQGGASHHESLNLKPGINFVHLPLTGGALSPVLLTVRQHGRAIDALEVPLRHEPLHWSSPRSRQIDLAATRVPLDLPADARQVRVRFSTGADAHFARVAEDLIEYPYGCVEQTASRLIPLALAIQSMNDVAPDSLLRQRLYSQRFRLAQMAGPNARFTWWGDSTGDDAFLTAYAYYADWLASRSLGLILPPEHWNRLLNSYAASGYRLPPLQRALALAWMQEIGLPVVSLVEALADDLAGIDKAAASRHGDGDSIAMTDPAGRRGVAAARVLTAHTARQAGARVSKTLEASEAADLDVLKSAKRPFENALLLLTGKASGLLPEQVLAAASPASPTFERAMALVWTHRALGGKLGGGAASPVPAAPWRKVVTATGRSAFVLPAGTATPKTLDLAAAPAAGSVAFVDYESRAPQAGSLPVTVERRLYRLVQAATTRQEADGTPRRGQTSAPDTVAFSAEFSLEAVARNGVVHSNEVYLDEIVLRPNGTPMHYGLLEAALPPGAAVEKSTWGISLRRGGKGAEAMEKARQENTRFGYAVPVAPLDREVTIRHLLRFSQKGQFQLPPARFHRMYQPEQKAFEAKDRAWTSVRVD
ncbi:alpha-2-macroglobulin [Azonexus sp.]|uniref:alpha-2-macroglobulin family protein n=1 Tax=Azonexus sp. TaxID=1872668 RepID=UPI0035B269DC